MVDIKYCLFSEKNRGKIFELKKKLVFLNYEVSLLNLCLLLQKL